MNLVNQLKKIEQYICTHYEDWDLDDPVAEEYYQDYQQISGASLEELQSLEQRVEIVLPQDVKALYQYKNGSGYFRLLPTMVGKSDMAFCLMSLEEIQRTKESFQNRDALLTDFADCFSKEDIEKMKDNRIQPYLFNKKWIPFAQFFDSCYLMLDFAPGAEGEAGQIICYIHDPDKVVYVAKSLRDLVAAIAAEI
jgi:cell wall assembly regulator SMI1